MKRLLPLRHSTLLTKPLRILLALAIALSSIALPGAFLPTALAGNEDKPLEVRAMGTCQDASGLHVLTFGLGIDGTQIPDGDGPTGSAQPVNGAFNVSGLPGGATIVEAWLFWNGSDLGNVPNDDPSTFNPATNDGDPTVRLAGFPVPNPAGLPLRFGPAYVGNSDFSYAYRADVRGIVTGNGPYTLTGIENLDNFINGAELVILYRDVARKPYYFGIAEGLDVMIGSGGPPGTSAGSAAVIYTFAPAAVARTANMTVFLGGAFNDPSLIENKLWYETGTNANLPPTPPPPAQPSIIGRPGATQVSEPFNGLNNQASNLSWDSYSFTVNIPAGNTWAAVQVESLDQVAPAVSQRLEWVGATAEMPLACPEYTLTKTRTTPDFVQAGQPVTYDIVMANIGNTDIYTATLRDNYDTTYLIYGFGGNFSTPASNDNIDDGQIDWATGQGIGPILFGQSKTVTVRFTAKASTEPIVGPPVDRTINTASTVTVADQNGTTAPPKTASDNVEITNPGVTVVKTLLLPADGSTAVGGQVQWRIRVTNSGDTILNTVPLADTYNTTYLTYGFGGNFSTPASNDNVDDGTLNWTDITGAGTLAPGNFIDVTVNMTAKASTQLLANQQTINTATVAGATDENGDTPPTASDTEPVEIGNPAITVVKTLLLPADGSTAVGGQVQWRIRVTNNGDTILNTVPLADTYSTTYLTYGFGGNFSTPASNDNVDDGTLNWTDITGAGTLTPGNFIDVTVNMTAKASTQLLANQQTINTATVTGAVDENNDTPPTASDTEPVEVGNPAITVLKTLVIPASGSTTIGGQVQWRIRVTNSGDTILNTVPLADTYSTTYLTYGYLGTFSTPASNDNTDDGTLNWTDITGAGTLAPGNFIDVTVNMTAKASTLAQPGQQTINTGTVTGATDENGDTPPTASDTEPVKIGNSGVTVLKTLLLPADGSTAVGGQVQWRIRVTNSGDTILNTVPLADTYSTTYLTYGYLGTFSTPASDDNTDDGTLNWTDLTGAGTLAPAAFIDVTVNMTAKASTQLLANQQTINTGTVAGAVDENNNTVPTASDTEPVEVGNPSITVLKTIVLPADGSTTIGGQVQWRIRVTNNGDTILNTVPLADTYNTTYLTYGYLGTFSSPASNDNVDDGTLNWTDITGAGTLAPGNFIDVTVNMTAKASTQLLANQQTINTATVAGATDENGDTPPTASDTEPVEVGNPSITVLKTIVIPADGSTAVGGQVQWRIRVTNNGDTILNTVPLADTYNTTYLTYGFGGNFSTPASNDNIDDGTLNWADITGAGTLAPAAFIDVTVNMTAKASTQLLANQQTINTGTVTGATDENGDTPPTASDTEPVEVGNPVITVLKTLLLPADGSTAVGGQVQWRIRVTNSGDTILNTVPLADTYSTTYLTYGFGGNFSTPASNDNIDDGTLNWTDITGAGTLAPGNSIDVTVNMTAKAGTQLLANQQTINTATVTGATDENGDTPPTASDTEPVEVGNPAVTVLKTLIIPAGGSASVGGQVQWRIRVTNSGDTILNTVPLADTYNTTYLTYGFGGSFSTPASNDNTNDGTLNWTDITGAGTLAPGSFIDVTVNMTAASSTQSLPNQQTINTGTVTGAVDENGDTAPTASETEPVRVISGAAIGDYVWYDANADGIQDVTENGIGNVTVDLWLDNGNSIIDGGDTFIGTKTTGADGGYIFKDLGAGTYIVDVTDTNGILIGLTHPTGVESKPDPFVVTIASGEFYEDADFGYVRTPTTGNGLIGDTVWLDQNQNGVQDPGEPGLPGVQVTLKTPGPDGIPGNGDDVTVGAPTTTNPNGNYQFNNVPPGTYYVDVTGGVPGGLSPSPAAPDPTTVFVLAAGDQYLDADIGFYDPGTQDVLGTIGNLVFRDIGNDGVFNVGVDSPFGGVSVDLIRDTDNDGIRDAGEPIVATTTTATTLGPNNSNYVFTGLVAGRYLVVVSDTANVLTAYGPTLLGAANTDNNNQSQPYPVNLAAGANVITADFGYVLTSPPGNNGIIGNQVWNDVNGDGIYNPANGDTGIEGVTVELRDNLGNLVATTTTGPSGDYAFTGLPAGTYRVRVTDTANVLAGYIVTKLPADQVSDNNNKLQAYTVVLPADGISLTADFGYIRPGAIGDFIWYDANGDATQDVGEPGIPWVTVDLYSVGPNGVKGGGDDVLLQSTQTDADGGYIFKNLLPGTYYVDVTDLNGNLAGLTHPTGPQSQPDTSNPITVGVGQVDKTADFGYYQPPLTPGNAVIGDLVWYDQNQNGIQDPGEPGIAGVTVQLVNASTNLPVGAPTTTDQNGNYLFPDVPPGTYYVQASGAPLTNLTPSPNASNPTTPFTVGANEQYLDADLGFYDAPGGLSVLGTVGNQVFKDVDKDGAYIPANGDTPLLGVSVDLIHDIDNDGVWDVNEPVIATDTTDQSGLYSFTGVPAGNYLVHVSDTNAVLLDYVKSTATGPANVDNRNQADPYRVVLGAGATNNTADFGYYPANREDIGVVGNQVWVETDYNGAYDAASKDVGQAGVTVDLYLNSVYYATTTTGASGDYSFTGLPSGVYSVRVTDAQSALSGYAATLFPVNQTADNNNKTQPYGINLPQTGVNLTGDFGYIQPGSIGDYVWYDANGDSIQDVTENGLGNVTIDLWKDNNNSGTIDGGDTLIGAKTTGLDGGYNFTGLLPGAYIVDVTDTKGILTGLAHPTGLQSQTDPFALTLTAGQVYQNADFGYVRVPTSGGVIGDTVWMDQNQNGVQDPGEPGIPGVTVTLKTPGPDGIPGNGDDVTITSTTTNPNGNYQFNNVPAGTYYVDATAGIPAGVTPSPLAPDPTTVFVLNAGDQYLDADIGFVDTGTPNTSSIGGTVWKDTPTTDGILGGGEPRFPGVTVDLINPGNGNIVATAVTDQNGDFLFTGLQPGAYQVRVTDTANVLTDYTPTTIIGGVADGTNKAQPYSVTIVAGVPNTTADFGYVPTDNTGHGGVIGNQVWNDVNGDGLYNPASGDAGIEGVTVELLDSANNVIATATTGPTGLYAFTGLSAGVYKVRVTDTAGILAGYLVTKLGSTPGADNNNQAQPYTINLPVDGINMTADFGYIRPGAIGDFIWYDANGDSTQDVGEPGIPWVTVDLYSVGPNGVKGGGDDVLLQSTQTDADGGYIFKNLLPGTYYVDVTDLNGNLAGMTHPTGPQSQPDSSNPITVGVGQVDKTADFGYYQPPLTPGNAVIGDLVWYDQNTNGIQDPGEPGFANVTVQLRRTSDNALMFTTTTDQNGNYLFPNVPAGTYYVDVTAGVPAGLSFSPAAPDPTVSFSVVANQQYLNADIGFYDPPGGTNVLGTIGNLVFKDVNEDGVYGGTDTPLVGVSVDLIHDIDNDGVWDVNEPVIATDTTDQSGLYSFTGVPAGNYLVHVSDTNAVLLDYVQTPTTGPANVDNRNQADPYRVVLGAGATNNTADFGYYPANREDIGVVGNQVWVETDYNGAYDAASKDVGQAGVTVDLYRNGVYYATTTTGASGDYSFTGLPSGVYSVRVTDTQNALTGLINTFFPVNQTADNNNKTQPYGINLPQTGVNLTGDFGYIRPVTIGDFIFQDPNANKIQDPAETVGIPNVPVTATNLTTGQVFTTQSGPTGSYQFTNLPPGTYSVSAPPTLPLYLRTTDAPIIRTLPAGTVDNNFDFGYINPTSVALSYFHYGVSQTGVIVYWSTLFEEASDKFFIYRSLSETGARTLLTPDGIAAKGNADGSSYQLTDSAVTQGTTYYYWIEIRPQGDVFGPLVAPYRQPDAGAIKLFLPKLSR